MSIVIAVLVLIFVLGAVLGAIGGGAPSIPPAEAPSVPAGGRAGQAPPAIGGLAPALRPFDAIIEYRDAEGAVTKRTITVQRLNGRKPTAKRGYAVAEVQAYCHLRRGHRTFMLPRIKSLADPTTGEVVADAHAWLLRRSGLPPSSFPRELLEYGVRFDPPLRALVETPPGKTTKPRRWLAEFRRVSVSGGQVVSATCTLRDPAQPDGSQRDRVYRPDGATALTQIASLTPDGEASPVPDAWLWLLSKADAVR